MLPLLPLLHYGSRSEGAEDWVRETEGKKEEMKKKKKTTEGRGWGPNYLLTKPPAQSPEICWQTTEEVGRSQRGWGPCQKPGRRECKRGRTGGRREGEWERNRGRDGGLIHCSYSHCHQEFISSWKGVNEGWKKGREMEDEHSVLHWQRPPIYHLPVYIPARPLLHPSCRLSSYPPYISSSPLPPSFLSLLASPSLFSPL